MPEHAVTRFHIQAWDPAFGAEIGFEEGGEAAPAEIDLETEVPLAEWAPIGPGEVTRETIWFIDGVRRIDARGTLLGSPPDPAPLLLASIASGACRCGERATVESAGVGRLLLCHRRASLEDLRLSFGTYVSHPVEEPGLPGLLNGLRRLLREHERDTAARLGSGELVVVDGPLTGTTEQHPDHLIGYVKSHHTSYLTGPAERTLLRLLPGERTPLFLIEGSWPRYSCYLRLPCHRANQGAEDWRGLCRLEFSARLPAAEAISRATRVAGLLPRFASSEHRETRAPQNLYPISGLEQILRNRLGDPSIVLREILRVE